MITFLSLIEIPMATACFELYNTSIQLFNDTFCYPYFDRISCWPPTAPGVRQRISCPPDIFQDAKKDAYATRLCTKQGRWEERGNYELCIGCPSLDLTNSTTTFSLPDVYIQARRYFIICANGLSIVFLILGILILLGNSRLRRHSRNILHVNMFLVFLIRSIIQMIAELLMSKGYFAHNVFERVDACNRTITYVQEGKLLDCKFFTMFMNYINSSVAHWFVFCEALYLYRLLRAKGCYDRIHWYIITGWCVPLLLTTITYSIRFIVKQDFQTCWFEPSIYDWILHGPNVFLQIVDFLIFSYICILLVRKLNEDYRTVAMVEHRPSAKYSRLTRSTLILLPIFSIHYFLFLWNTKPLLISQLILIHLTVHTIFSSLQGFMVALIYTFINGEVQRELLRSIDRWCVRHCSSWRAPKYFRDYMGKLDSDRLYSCHEQTRTSLPLSLRSNPSLNLLQSYQRINQLRGSVDYQQICLNEINRIVT